MTLSGLEAEPTRVSFAPAAGRDRFAPVAGQSVLPYSVTRLSAMRIEARDQSEDIKLLGRGDHLHSRIGIGAGVDRSEIPTSTPTGIMTN